MNSTIPSPNATPESPLTARLLRRHRLRAFMIIALASYLLACLAYSTMTRGFATESQIHVTVQDEYQFEQKIRALLDQQTRAETLDETIEEVANTTGLQSPLLIEPEHELLQTALRIKVERHVDRPEYRVRVILDGHGTPDERMLVDKLATQIREQLSQQWAVAERQREIDDQFHLMFSELDRFSHDQERGLELSRNIIANIDQGLGDVYQAVVGIQREAPGTTSPTVAKQVDPELESLKGARGELLAERAKLLANLNAEHPRVVQLDRAIRQLDQQLQTAARPTTPFIHVGNKNAVSSQMRDVLVRLEKMDVQPLLEQIATLSDSLETHAIGQRENLATLQSLLQTRIDNVYAVDRETHLSNVPIGGVPSGRGLLAMLTLSCLIAMYVARRYQPEKTQCGFSNTKEIREKLGIPVVATLSQANFRLASQSQVPLANRLVRYAEVALFSVSLLLVTACLFQPAIRQAFLENPFHGLARLSWMLLGGH